MPGPESVPEERKQEPESTPEPEHPAPQVDPPKTRVVSHDQLEAIAAAATVGDVERLQHLFHDIISETGCQQFVLANDAAPRTGLTALHHAASRGHLSVVEWRT